MCDYSLMMNVNRLGKEGEDLVAHRFKTGSIGLVSVADHEDWLGQRGSGLWQRVKDYFTFEGDPQPVVCVPPGARLRLHDYGSCETATFTQLSPEANRHRDALLFDNGKTVTLESLPEGQVMTLVRMSSEEDVEEPQAAEPVLAGRF
jgi:hypothetical protein